MPSRHTSPKRGALVLLAAGLAAVAFGLVALPLTTAYTTGKSLERVTPFVTDSGPVEEAVSLPESASTGWWATVQDDISRSEYRVTWQDRTYLPDLPAAF